MTFLIRPANMGDLQPIYEMAKRTGGGFTNLPPDKKALFAKLERSAAGFDRVGDEVADDLYVFVLQNTLTGEVRGKGGLTDSPQRDHPPVSGSRAAEAAIECSIWAEVGH